MSTLTAKPRGNYVIFCTGLIDPALSNRLGTEGYQPKGGACLVIVQQKIVYSGSVYGCPVPLPGISLSSAPSSPEHEEDSSSSSSSSSPCSSSSSSSSTTPSPSPSPSSSATSLPAPIPTITSAAAAVAATGGPGPGQGPGAASAAAAAAAGGGGGNHLGVPAGSIFSPPTSPYRPATSQPITSPFRHSCTLGHPTSPSSSLAPSPSTSPATLPHSFMTSSTTTSFHFDPTYLTLSYQYIDLGKDSWVLPGFIDAHCHPFIVDSPLAGGYQWKALADSGPYKTLRALKRVQEYLQAGWTTIRIAGDAEVGYGVLDLQRAIEEEMFVGPRIQAAAHYLSILGGGGDLRLGAENAACVHPDGRIVSGPEEMRRVVREEIKFGSKWIKLLVSGAFTTAHDRPSDCHFSSEEVLMAGKEASRLSTPMMCHAHSVASIELSLKAGARSIEHGTFLAQKPALLDGFLRQKTFLVPTLFIGDFYSRIRQPLPTLPPLSSYPFSSSSYPSSSSTPSSPFVSPSTSATTLPSIPHTSANLQEVDPMKKMIELSKETRQLHLRGVKMAFEAGVPICTGSDDMGCWPPAWSMRELTILQEAGLPAMECIKAATVHGSALLGLQTTIGSIQPGFEADIIAVRGNPLYNLTLLESNLFFVMRSGRIIINKEDSDS